ncbi:ciliary rootlet coiled-coil protein 2-like [Manihot esculenta]|uniref:ciliary rootlet coiled-coil protein 2-like n=1 Tax=Manihot esculenta TaxID=3983 RepID=UPI001CC5FF9C|nr:ciliary rootlet coiled-coil protein 2-like [Manihot esculenta]
MTTGIFMEMDSQDRALMDSVDRHIKEARLEENLSATSDARSNLATAHEHAKSLEAELSHTRRVLKESDERAAAAEVRCEEVLKQLSSMVEALREKDEAVSQRDKVWRQYEALKADFDRAQAHLAKVKIQMKGALARVEVLEQELSKSSDRIRDLASAAEESELHNQALRHEVKTLEHRCSALLEDARLVEDRIQLECERRLMEYKESPELKKEIEQACEARLQDYKSSSEFKAKVAEACEERLAEFKAFDEMKATVWNKSFRMFVSGYNRGLRIARYTPSTPLAKLQAAKVDSDGEEVLYGEDDRPLPKGASRTAARSSGAEPELEDEDVGPQGQEIMPFIGTGGSKQEGDGPPMSGSVNNVGVDSADARVDDNAPRRLHWATYSVKQSNLSIMKHLNYVLRNFSKESTILFFPFCLQAHQN